MLAVTLYFKIVYKPSVNARLAKWVLFTKTIPECLSSEVLSNEQSQDR